MVHVRGNDMVLLALKLGTYVPIACVTGFDWLTENDEYETTVPDTAGGATFVLGPTPRGLLNVSGVTFLRDTSAPNGKYFALDMHPETVRKTGLDWRIEWTDLDGHERSVNFFGLIPNFRMFTEADPGLAEWNLSIRVSGSVTYDQPSTPVTMSLTRIAWEIASAGTAFVQDNRLINIDPAQIKHTSREGDDKYSIISSGTPNERQALHTAANGRISFNTTLNEGEYVYILVEL